MAMLIRYKKKGGFFQLVQLIETSQEKKREQFLNLIKEENSTWEAELRSKILTCEKVLSWEASVLSEIISRVPPLTLSTILQTRKKSEYDKLYSVMSFADQRRYQDNLPSSPPNSGEIQTAENKFLSEVRNLISMGTIKLEKIDSSLIIADNIEELLESANSEQTNKISLKNASDAKLTNLQEPSKLEKSEIFNQSNHIATSEEIKIETQFTQEEKKSLKNLTNIEELNNKINILVIELSETKKENQLLKEKLEKIKKIA